MAINNELSTKEIIDILSSESNLTNYHVSRILVNLIELIISEIKLNGYFHIKNFGKFELEVIEPHDEIIVNEKGTKKKIHVDEHYDIYFTPSVNLISAIEGRRKWSVFCKPNYTDEDEALINKNRLLDVIKDSEEKVEENIEPPKKIIKPLRERIAIQCKKKVTRDKNKIARDNGKNIRQETGFAIKHLDSGVVYSSIRSCAKDLGFIYQNLWRHYTQATEDTFKYKGYEFAKIAVTNENEQSEVD